MGKPLGPTGEFFRRRDEWRKHPMLSNQIRHATPGLGIGIVAFGVYLAAEYAYNNFYSPSSQHHHHQSSTSDATH
uniref:Uncharacterized protein n=1 Tax=Kalanchoe fedtschenkoi TaxID=63787 RepID=A0A7N0TWC4_KALFE